ncbi:hypothetical protein GCM10010249_52960 [Streptomyces roseolilacinus]|uniref:Uncharacterized protein n=1 Tax=Streptomyces roseolilacinus TaxID=66904 RepID=A0A918B4E4_9ACTN|nr:hypothetical protein GCM10010249_52960 [Streptomyces roseolilacinus]
MPAEPDRGPKAAGPVAAPADGAARTAVRARAACDRAAPAPGMAAATPPRVRIAGAGGGVVRAGGRPRVRRPSGHPRAAPGVAR